MANRQPVVFGGNRLQRIAASDTIDPAFLPQPDGINWQVVTVSSAILSRNAFIAKGAVTLNITLPASTAVGDQFFVHAKDGDHRVVSNGNIITGVGSGNDLLIADGETAWLVASAAGQLEIV